MADQSSSGAPQGLGTSMSKAAQPVGDNMIVTDAEGLDVGEARIESLGFSVPVYYARPAGGKTAPIILVVSEVFGVHAHIADVCRRFAKLGYFAVAADLFARYGDGAAYESLADLMREVVAKVKDSEVLADLDALAQWAGAQGGDLDRLSVTGFCWGGRITWLYSVHNPRVKAGVAWYGRLAGDTTEATPAHPVSLVRNLKAPVLGLYAGQDPIVPPEAREATEAELAAGGAAARSSRIVVYPDAGHAFFADYRASYREHDARDGWQRCLAWLADHGVAPAESASA
jgi:carboxymethylenebutenolidase